jgi:tetratricopeptide (TPR) repeat protein
MKQNREKSAAALTRLLGEAREARERQDFSRSLDLFEQAHRIVPANAAVLLDVGFAHGLLHNYEAADRCFNEAERRSPRKADVLAMAGLHSRNFMRYEMARNYFERATKLPGATPDSFVKLAELYERFRLLEEAAEAVDQALERDPKCALALLVRARLDRLGGKLESAEKLVRSFVTGSDPNTWSTRIRGWYELGAILDRQGRYDEAMAAFHSAKALIRPNAGLFIAGQRMAQERLREAEVNITAAVLARWVESAPNPPLTHRVAFLCGHPRSGTTLLEQVLDSHPEAISSEETAIFFQTYVDLKRGMPDDTLMYSVLESASPTTLKLARENYSRSTELLLGQPISGRLLIDKNPSLTALAPAILRVLPEAKFLLALRDPRDVVLSCFMQPLPMNPVSSAFLSLEGSVAEYVSLMGFWQTIAARMPNPPLEVRYEEMVADLEKVARRVLEFLGLPWDERVLRFNEFARQKLVRSPTYADVAKPVFKGAIGRWRNYQKHLEPFLDKLSPLLKSSGYE